jgi:two-component system, NtrC family, nitrogen regulation sensor histidine kinase GlnL
MARKPARTSIFSRPSPWRDVIDSLSGALIVLSPDTKLMAANPAAESLLAASPVGSGLIEEMLRNNPWLSRMTATCLKTGQSLEDREAELHLGTRSIAVRAEVSPLLSGAGRLEGILILLADLSQQRSAEHAIEQAAPNLRLSAAGLAHEVKNPLTGIKGAAELVAALYPAEHRVQQYCGVILDGVNRIAALVEEVLAASSPQRLADESVNIHMVLHAALRMAGLFPKVPEGLRIEQDFDPSLPDVLGDRAALERAFLNLIKNAAEAIGQRGTIRLQTRMETEFLMTAEGRRRQFLRVDISDSGPGMSERDLAQLFTPFFTTKPLGTGLGLVLSHRIISLHGGRLWAERGGVAGAAGENPVGMTFRVLLPVAAATDGS